MATTGKHFEILFVGGLQDGKTGSINAATGRPPAILKVPIVDELTQRVSWGHLFYGTLEPLIRIQKYFKCGIDDDSGVIVYADRDLLEEMSIHRFDD